MIGTSRAFRSLIVFLGVAFCLPLAKAQQQSLDTISPNEINTALFNALDAYDQGAAATLGFRLLQRTLEFRQQQLLRLMDSHPGAVLGAALPDDIRERIPQGLQGLIERRVRLDGEMEVSIEDGPTIHGCTTALSRRAGACNYILRTKFRRKYKLGRWSRLRGSSWEIT